jgi:Flp pilus assembly protein TadD
LTRRLLLALAVLGAGAAAGCASAPPRREDASVASARVFATQAEAAAAEGRLRDALDGYREAARLVPSDERYVAREKELRTMLVERRVREADEDLEKKDVAGARRAAVSILEIDPQAAEGYRCLAKAAEAGGALEDAWSAAKRAYEIEPGDVATTEALASLAMKTGRWAEAESLFGQLGKTDPAFREKAAAAGLEFRIQNLPGPARRAALSPRLTRAQLAALLVELSPEVREARVPPGAEVAVDVVDRPERTALVRTIGLGFFAVSRDAHLVGADNPVSRSEMPAHLRRLAALAGGALPCTASLAECGILPEGSRQIGGREAVAAIEATLRLARAGGSR